MGNGNITIHDSWGIYFSPFAASPLMEKNPIPTSPQMRITSIHNFKLFCWFNQGPLITGQVQVVTLLHSYESSLISYWTLKTAKIGSLESNFIHFNSPKLILYFCYLSFYVSKLLPAPQLIIMQVCIKCILVKKNCETISLFLIKRNSNEATKVIDANSLPRYLLRCWK